MRVQLRSELAAHAKPVIQSFIDHKIASRIAAKDSSIWGQDAAQEASARLGWVTSPKDSRNLLPSIRSLRD